MSQQVYAPDPTVDAVQGDVIGFPCEHTLPRVGHCDLRTVKLITIELSGERLGKAEQRMPRPDECPQHIKQEPVANHLCT